MTVSRGRKGRRGSAGTRANISGGGDPAQLLPQAVNAHQAGNLARARMLYEQVLAHHPDHPDALQYLGILCHQEGEVTRAEALIRGAVAVRPDAGIYLDNLGTVLDGAGRTEEALAAYLRAEELDGRDPERDYNLGIVLHRLARHREAETRFRAALATAPEDPAVLFALANTLRDGGQLREAEAVYLQLLSLTPRDPRVRLNLGNLQQAAGRLEDAERTFRTVLEHHADHPGALHNLGSVLRQRGELAQALECFESALERDGTLHAARLGRAEVFELLGRMDQALQVYRQLLGVPEVEARARRAVLRVLSVWTPEAADEGLMACMATALAAGEVEAGALGRSGFSLLVMRYRLDSALSGTALAEAAEALNDDPLCLTLLGATVNVVPQMERWLAAARSAVLIDPPLRRASVPLLGAVAAQCRLNEFVMDPAPGDAAAVCDLATRLDSTLASGSGPDPELYADILGYACFEPLSRLCDAAQARLCELQHRDLRRLVEMDIVEPRTEQAIAAEMDTLAGISDPVSSVVREQYERNPYPRWSELPTATRRPLFSAALSDTAPQQVGRLRGRALSILVAGCGTGQEALAIAAAMPGCAVTGLDLSLSSLAYARRMANVLGHANVRFVQGDLLDVAAFASRFDVVAVSGVLHHMQDPAEGWKALLEVLDGDGLMKVALYSHQARSVVRTARSRIEELGLAADAAGVRSFRRRVLGNDEPALRALLDSEDFYGVSSCRDLLFHPVEHQFTLPRLETLLAQLRLEFLGFELPHALLRHRFLAEHPGALLDLRAWHRFEQRHPDTFGAMYVFWCRPSRD